jgi:PAS domain S-box-containing protein
MKNEELLEHFAKEDLYELILQSMEDGVYLIDSEHRVAFWNEAAGHITGHMSHEVLGRKCAGSLLSHSGENGFPLFAGSCPITETLADGKSRSMDAFIRHKEGHQIPVHLRTAPVHNQAGKVIGAVELFHADTDHYGLQQKFKGLEHKGCLDAGTGIANREMTMTRLRHRLEDLQSFGIPLGMIMIGFPERQALQAQYGQEAWHALIRTAAQTLAQIIPPNGFLGRWEDDRFLVLLGNCDMIQLHLIAKRVTGLVSSSEIKWWGDPLRTAVKVTSAMAEPIDTPEKAVERLDFSVS